MIFNARDGRSRREEIEWSTTAAASDGPVGWLGSIAATSSRLFEQPVTNHFSRIPKQTRTWIPHPEDQTIMQEKRLIIDVGVHRGEDTEFYLKKGFRVLGIEANPDLYKHVSDRLRNWIEQGDLTLLNVAVAPDDGPVTFYANLEKSEWGTISSDWADRNQNLQTRSVQISVEGRRFETVLTEFGVPYYLKVDIEGADLLCMKALRQATNKPKYVSLESCQTTWKGLLEEFSVLRELGYRKFKVVSQDDVPSQVCPNPAREGEFVDHSFAYGSSGAFGDEIPGEWVTEQDAIQLYRRIFRRYRLFGNDGFMTRMNWQRPLIWRLRKYLPATLPIPDWYDTHAAL